MVQINGLMKIALAIELHLFSIKFCIHDTWKCRLQKGRHFVSTSLSMLNKVYNGFIRDYRNKSEMKELFSCMYQK